MPEPLYALQRDLDMIAQQVNILTVSLNKLDWIAQKVKKIEEEQTCQAEQMRRMETLMFDMGRRLRILEDKMQNVEENLEKILRILGVVVKNLGIENEI